MEKLELKYSSNNNEEIIKRIKANEVASKLINDLSLTDKQIIENSEMINNYIETNKCCQKCKSMKDCLASTKGHKYGLKIDEIGYLTDYFTICDYYKDYYKRKKNLTYTTFNENDVLDENQKRFILDNPHLIGVNNIKRIIKIQKNETISGLFIQMSSSKLRLQLIKSLAYNLLSNHEVSIIKFSDALKTIKSEFNSKDDTNTFKTLCDSKILIIDGLGSESITNWSRDDILLSLLDNRLQSEKITILCSEFTLDDLKKVYKLGYNDDVKVNQLIQKIKDIDS